MRVTGGIIKGHKLQGPGKDKHLIRPTSDLVRESIFNILGDKVKDAMVLELFAGCGAFSIDALSRGAAQVCMVDNNRKALQIIAANLNKCFNQPPARIFQLDLTNNNCLSKLKNFLKVENYFNLIFSDPPYGKNLAEKSLKLIAESNLMADDGLVILEEEAKEVLPEEEGCLLLIDKRKYGKTCLWFYQNKKKKKI